MCAMGNKLVMTWVLQDAAAFMSKSALGPHAYKLTTSLAPV